MPVGPAILTAVLVGCLALVSLLADDALRAQGEAAAEAELTRTTEATRLSALSVRAVLARHEQDIAAERPLPDGLTVERAMLEPACTTIGEGPAYGRLSRTALVDLLRSRRATATGLPEAVVARIALGTSAPVTGSVDAPPDVTELLFAGALPVRADDLPYLGRALGTSGDPRIARLQQKLRALPRAETLPLAPAFRRTLVDGAVEGWTNHLGRAIHYTVPVAMLLARAGISTRARVASAGDGAAVADVPGLFLAVAPEGSSATRLHVQRAALWIAALACAAGLVALRRALAREAAANARERQFLASITH